MLLRELYEATESVGLIFGRFNPPHKGHRAAWEMASENSAWYVGTNKSTQGPKDPLPYDVKIKAMETIWPEVAGHIVPNQSWLTLASELYKKHGNVELKVYTDEDWVLKALAKYNGVEGAHGMYNFKKITSVPTPRLSSATALRTAVTNGDKQAFADAAGVPADTPVDGVPFFDLVAKYLGAYKKEAEAKSGKEIDAFHTDLDKLVHKHFGHSSDEEKEMKDVEEADFGSMPDPETILALAAAAKMTPMAIKAMLKTSKGVLALKRFANKAGIKFAHKVVGEKFASDAQRKAAFASGYKPKDKKKK